MEELKSRVISGLRACSNECCNGGKPCPYFPAHDTDCIDRIHADAIKLIEQLSAEGLWIYCPDDEGRPRWKCSRCGKYVHKDPAEKLYCALCGQRNRKEA